VSSVAIVGGGMLGMTLAARLAQAGHRVTLLEAAPSTGGLASACRHGEYTWDRFYHVILMSDLRLRALLEELGLADRLRWGTTRTGFYVDGRLHSLSNSLDFALFPPLSLVDKARLAWTITYASRIRDWQSLERVPVADWLRRLSGTRVFERIWLPLLRAKLGENYRHASAAFIWAIIARMYAARRSGLKQERFGYVEGGYAVVLERLQRHLDSLGVVTRTRHPVREVRAREDAVDLAGPEGIDTFEHAVLTVPCGRIAAMVPQLSAAEQARLRGVTYQGIACASVLLRRPLATYYVTNITDDWVPFTGVIEMSTLVDPRAFGGNSLVYLPRYLAQDDPSWQLDDAAIRERFTAALERMYPAFRRDDILAFEVSRVREVLAVTTLDYSSRHLPPLATSVRGIHVVNSAQIAQGTLNVNETVSLAETQARALLEQFGLPRVPAGAAA
jgi:protoporphyrinogen oxidase